MLPSAIDAAAGNDTSPVAVTGDHATMARVQGFGNASRAMKSMRGFSDFAENLSLFKDTRGNQKFKLRFETQFANLFDRTVFYDPNRNWSVASCGRAFSQCTSRSAFTSACTLTASGVEPYVGYS